MPPATTAVPARHSKDRNLRLGAVCLAALVLPLDFSGAAAATPALGRAFGDHPLLLAWVVNAFMLTFGSTLLTAGALADVYGRKRVFAIGLAAFVVVSVALCGSRGLVMLDLLRGVQGVAAAATLAGGSAALAQEFEGTARTHAFSLLGTTFGTGLAFGPTIAGVLIETSGWRSIFLAGAAVGVLALAIGVPRMRETRDPAAGGPDWPGAVMFTAALSLLTAGLLQAGDSGLLSKPTLALLLVGALALAGFVQVERRAARPMLDLSLFSYPRFVGVQILPIATCCSYVVLLVLLPARFIGVESYREIDAGLLMLGLSMPMLIVPFVTALLTTRISPGVLSALGLLVAAGGLLWLADVPPGAPARQIIRPLIVIGLGTAMPWGLMDALSISVVPKDRAGMATGIFSTMRVAGEGIALAIVRAILAGLLHGVVPTRDHAVLMAYGAAFSSLLHLLALIVLAASLLILVCLREPTAPS